MLQAIDALFDEAAVAQHGRGGEKAPDPAAVDAAVERQVRAAWVHCNAVALALQQPETGPCDVTQCRGLWVPVSLFTVSAAAAAAAQLPARAVLSADVLFEGARVHACTGVYCDDVTDPVLHGRNVTDQMRALGAACAQPGSASGGVWHCARHMRMHVCRTPCRHTYETALGFAVCVLSGRTVQQAMQFAFGDGVAMVSQELAHDRQTERQEKRRATRQRDDMNPDISITTTTKRARPATALDRIIDRRGRGGDDDGGGRGTDARLLQPLSSSSSSPPVAADAGEDDGGGGGGAGYVDLDYPASDLFSNSGRANTFGDGLATEMLRVYSQAYTTVHLIIFSEDRARLEHVNTEARQAEALQRMRRYAADQTKDGLPVDLSTCRQLQDAALAKTRRVCKRLLVPVNAVCRMKAYYAAVCMEFFLQLTMRLTELRSGAGGGKLTDANRQLIDRFLTLNIADVAPNVFDIMHDGLRLKPNVIVPTEVLFQDLFPESMTLDRLGIRQKSCTEVMKLMKRCVVLAVRCNLPVDRMQTTQLDLTVVMHETSKPVLSLFLAARRARLGIQ